MVSRRVDLNYARSIYFCLVSLHQTTVNLLSIFYFLILGGVCCALAGALEFFEPGSGFLAFAICIRDREMVSNVVFFLEIIYKVNYFECLPFYKVHVFQNQLRHSILVCRMAISEVGTFFALSR